DQEDLLVSRNVEPVEVRRKPVEIAIAIAVREDQLLGIEDLVRRQSGLEGDRRKRDLRDAGGRERLVQHPVHQGAAALMHGEDEEGGELPRPPQVERGMPRRCPDDGSTHRAGCPLRLFRNRQLSSFCSTAAGACTILERAGAGQHPSWSSTSNAWKY